MSTVVSTDVFLVDDPHGVQRAVRGWVKQLVYGIVSDVLGESPNELCPDEAERTALLAMGIPTTFQAKASQSKRPAGRKRPRAQTCQQDACDESEELALENLQPGVIVECLYDEDQHWYPAEITSVFPSQTEQSSMTTCPTTKMSVHPHTSMQVAVTFLGYGNTATVGLQGLRPIKSREVRDWVWQQLGSLQNVCVAQELTRPAHVRFDDEAGAEIHEVVNQAAIPADSQPSLQSEASTAVSSESSTTPRSTPDTPDIVPDGLSESSGHSNRQSALTSAVQGQIIAAAATCPSPASPELVTIAPLSLCSSTSHATCALLTTLPEPPQAPALALHPGVAIGGPLPQTPLDGNMGLLLGMSPPSRRKSGKAGKKGRVKVPGGRIQSDLRETSPYAHVPSKYWAQRYRYFSLFDRGVLMDEEGWYSVTPEVIGHHIAERCRCDVVVDPFAGCGGNAIQFALASHLVIAIDIDPRKIECARHNARLYGVEDRIEFIVGDALLLLPSIRADVVFLSPPWGGPGYSGHARFDLHSMFPPPLTISAMIGAAREVTKEVVLFLPKNVEDQQLATLCGPGETCEVESNYLLGKLKAKTVYFGALAARPKRQRKRRAPSPVGTPAAAVADACTTADVKADLVPIDSHVTAAADPLYVKENIMYASWLAQIQ